MDFGFGGLRVRFRVYGFCFGLGVFSGGWWFGQSFLRLEAFGVIAKPDPYS